MSCGTQVINIAACTCPPVVLALNDLTDVDTATTPPVLGDVLTFDGSLWVPAASGGGGSSTTSAINGTSFNVPAFNILDYPNFALGGVTVAQSWVVLGATNQDINEAGKYLIRFSNVQALAYDFTVRPIKTFSGTVLSAYRGTGSFSGEVLAEWTAADILNDEQLKFEVQNNSGAAQTIILNISIEKVE